MNVEPSTSFTNTTACCPTHPINLKVIITRKNPSTFENGSHTNPTFSCIPFREATTCVVWSFLSISQGQRIEPPRCKLSTIVTARTLLIKQTRHFSRPLPSSTPQISLTRQTLRRVLVVFPATLLINPYESLYPYHEPRSELTGLHRNHSSINTHNLNACATKLSISPPVIYDGNIHWRPISIILILKRNPCQTKPFLFTVILDFISLYHIRLILSLLTMHSYFKGLQ